MKSTTFAVEGMHCGGCAQIIQALVGAEPGVRAVDASFKEGRARILYDPESIDEDRLARVIEQGGYRVPARTRASSALSVQSCCRSGSASSASSSRARSARA